MVGGVRTVTEILTAGFIKSGHKVSWLIRFGCYGNERDFPVGYDITYLPEYNLVTKTNVDFFNKLLEEKEIDIVINQDGLYEGGELIALARRKILNISVIHNNPLLNYEWLFKDVYTLRNSSFVEKCKRIARVIFFKKIKKQVYKSIRHRFYFLDSTDSIIVYLSSKYKDAVGLIHPINNVSVSIPNPNTFVTPHISGKEKIVLYVGRIDNRAKKIQYLIEIWIKLGIRTLGWKLIVVGEGDDIHNVKEMAKKSTNIHFVGYQKPDSYYQKASIICMTSIFEGFPMVLTEAMQHGCVPIAFNSFPAIYDIISSGYDGEIIKAFDKKDYAEKLLNLMNNNEYRETLSKHAIISVKRFDREIIIKEWEKLFERYANRN